MASLRDIRKHIKSVKSIKQITYAMKMVAAARIKRAQNAILSSRPFTLRMEQAIKDLYLELSEEDFRASPAYDLFEKKGSDAVALVLIASDKGLCGSFNAGLLKTAVAWLRQHKEKKISVITVGKKARDFFRRLKGLDMEIAYEMAGIFPKVNYVHSMLLTENIFRVYKQSRPASVTLIYNEFKSMSAQKIARMDILPLREHILETPFPTERNMRDFGFEPGKTALLEALLPRYVNAQIFRILLESQAAELAARMNAMEAASKNATELIEDLTLKLNKTRQAMITTELNEIVSGAEALAG